MNNIKEFRKLHCYKQKDLARLLGVSKNTISAWETGLFDPDLEHIVLLMNIFNTDFYHLFQCNDFDREELKVWLNKRERKEIKNMNLMVEGFGEIAKICNKESIMLSEDPEWVALNRYCQILEIIQFVEDNIKL